MGRKVRSPFEARGAARCDENVRSEARTDGGDVLVGPVGLRAPRRLAPGLCSARGHALWTGAASWTNARELKKMEFSQY